MDRLVCRLAALMSAGLIVAACTGGSSAVEVDQRTSAPAPGATDAAGTEPSAPATDPTQTTMPPSSEPTAGPEAEAPETTAGPETTAAPETTGPATNDVGVPVPDTDLEFTDCRRLDCATVAVAIDPDQPELGTIDIAINIVRSTDADERRGYLFINPGGPGGSGKQFAEVAPFFFPEVMLGAFDIVGFDPRGVAESEPQLGCGGRDVLREQTDQIDGFVDTPEEVAALETAVAVCSEFTGPAAPYLGTEFVAHDMDAIRVALGADQISYYGASYGSDVGVWYSSLYPDSVRAMVVDGADNPVDEFDTPEERIESQLEQVRAFEELLGLALESCDSRSCPIFNDGDPVAAYLAAVERIDLVNEVRPNLDDAGFFGVISTLYSESTWPELHRGLFELVENDDPSILAESSDFQASDSDIREIEWINCLDSWSIYPDYDRATQLEETASSNDVFDAEFPLLSAASTFDDATGLCPFLDTIAPDPVDVPLDGADVPIFVIGNPSDPATPFVESVELVEETLSNGYLLEADNPDHVVFGRGNQCVDQFVIDVLVDVEFPDDRRVVCER